MQRIEIELGRYQNRHRAQANEPANSVWKH
jgi:hypothetical protein